MTLQLNPNPEVDKLLLKHNNRPMKALQEILRDAANEVIELPMTIIMDPRCGIERRAEEGLPWDLNDATPLFMAIYAGRVDVALLAACADPNAKCSDGSTSLMESARNGDLEAIEFLISYGADIDAVDEDDRTPLHHAAMWGQAAVIELLERSGANLEAVDDKGRTPLHGAAYNGEAGAIKVLLMLGAKQAAVDKEGQTPLHIAAASKYARVNAIGAFRCNMAVFEANLTEVDKNGCTPLQVYKHRSSSDASKARALLTLK
eukprot:GILJ01024368.1.p1 GENE.GILJ01024368.1~~GILJ01024368.1.p1  ORF type:complete len:261 (-),score=42.01 GILJ01024368.1:547-1329(-)